MERPLSPFVFLAALALAALVVMGGSVLLPHDRYYRFQAHDSGTTRKADWIYERLHFDPAPVDVALIGTSRTAGGLSEAIIETEFCRAAGRRIRVANLGIPETGRNMHYVIAKEAARTKAPKLYIVELNEVESRKPHDGFIVLADAADVITAPAALNLNYVQDLVRLPGRQASLFVETLTRRPAVRAAFDGAQYEGEHFDRTTALKLLDGRIIDKDVVKPKPEMDAAHEERAANVAPLHALPHPLRPLEYRFSRLYLDRIEALAFQAGGAVDYAYLPAYRAEAIPEDLLDELGVRRVDYDLGGGAAQDSSYWFDATHVNARGARLASVRLGRALAEARPGLGEPGPDRPGACGDYSVSAGP